LTRLVVRKIQRYDGACRAYDRLVDEQPIEFHAAYIANLHPTVQSQSGQPGGRHRRARRRGPPTLFHAVPTSQLVQMVWRLALSHTPYHDPADQPLPDRADIWMREYDRGVDMTTFAGGAGRRAEG